MDFFTIILIIAFTIGLGMFLFCMVADWNPLPVVGMLGVVMLIAAFIPSKSVETAATTPHAVATQYLTSLGYALRSDMLCTAIDVDFFTTGWSCSGVTEPDGVLRTLHCGRTTCWVPVR